MPIDAAIPLQVRPPQAPINPLADVAQIMQLRQAQQLLPLKIQEAQQNQQEGAMRLQEMQRQVNDRKALDAAYSGAVSNDPDTGLPTFDRAKLSDALIKSGQGHQVPVLMKTLDDSAEAHTKILKAQSDLQQAHIENGAAIGAGSEATGWDPTLFAHRLQIGIANGSLDPKNVQPILQELAQANQQDPSGKLGSGIVEKYSRSLMDQSEKMRNSMGSQERGDAAKKQADTASSREGREAAAQGFTQAVGALATNPPKDTATYQQQLDAMPHGIAQRILQAVPVEQYDPSKAADAFNKAGMTPNERFKADNPNEAGERNPTEVSLSLAAVKAAHPTWTEAQIYDGALKRLDQSKIAARPVTNLTLPSGGPQNPNAPPQSQGEDFLKTLSPSMAAQVKAIAEGQDGMPPANSRSQAAIQLRDMVYRYDPQFSTQRAQIRRSFTTGADARNIRALNTAPVHLDQLQDAADAMQNGNFRPGNAVFNSLKSTFGGSTPTNFEGVKAAVSSEMASALKGNATDQEIKNIQSTVDASSSPAQLKGIINENLNILAKKLNTYHEAYQQQIPDDKNWSPVLPSASAVFAKHGVNTGPVTQQGGGGAQGGYIVGHKYGGLTYSGGDPNKRENWK